MDIIFKDHVLSIVFVVVVVVVVFFCLKLFFIDMRFEYDGISCKFVCFIVMRNKCRYL